MQTPQGTDTPRSNKLLYLPSTVLRVPMDYVVLWNQSWNPASVLRSDSEILYARAYAYVQYSTVQYHTSGHEEIDEMKKKIEMKRYTHSVNSLRNFPFP
jgi:hypothetical protein